MPPEAGLRHHPQLCSTDPGTGHESTEPLYGGMIERCPRCGIVATREIPTFEYDETYFVNEEHGGYAFDSVFSQTLDAKRFDAELANLEEEGLHGSVLDVGCATGTFLSRAASRGWQCTGVEIAEYARQRVSTELGIPVAASLADLPDDARFDLVTLHHVLEHIHEPLAFLTDEVAPRVGKRLLIEVPNFASLASKVHGPSWRDLRPDQHVLHFTPDTLPRIVEQAGFKIRRVYTLSEPLWSLRSTLYTLGLLRGLVRTPSHNGTLPKIDGTAGTRDITTYRPPTGLKGAATEMSRVLMSPVVGYLTRSGLAERLVVQAEL